MKRLTNYRGYKTVSEFAKTYFNRIGEPVTRQYIYELQRKQNRAAKRLEFKWFSGVLFVRFKKSKGYPAANIYLPKTGNN